MTKEVMLEGIPGFAKVLGMVGATGVIAMYTVWVLSTGVASAEQVRALDVKIDLHVRQQQDQTNLLEAQVRLLRMMCGSLAKSEAARFACNQ